MSICFTTSVSLIIVLFFISRNKNHHNNQFTRLFPSHFISKPRQFNLKLNSYYLAGLSRTTIFLGNRTSASFILQSNYELTDTGHMRLKVPPETRILNEGTQVIVDSPDIFMMDGFTPIVLHGTLDRPFMVENGFHTGPFDAFSIIAKKSFAIRTYDWDRRQNILAKSMKYSAKPLYARSILTRMGDGVFSLDGNLVQDSYTGHLIYVYFYRNEYIELDTNLNILYRGKTIDSIISPQIKLSGILSDSTVTFAAPPLTVNKTCCADSGFLFINSKLRAKNEDEDEFNQNSVIDIYSLAKNEYLYSFYIPDDNGIKIRSFRVFNHQLVALYDHTIITFSILF